MSHVVEEARLRARRALAALALGRYPEAEREAGLALAAAPSWAYGHYLLAHALAGGGAWARAREQAEEAVSLEPTSAEFHAYLSSTQRATGLPSMDSLIEAVRLAPDQPRYLVELARQKAIAQHAEEAYPLIERALALAPDDPSLLLQVARAYVVLGRYDRARAHCFLAMDAGGDPAHSQALLAFLDERQGDFAQSAQLIRESLRSAPDDGAAIASYGRTLVELGRLDEAAEMLALAEQTDPDSHELHVARGRLEARQAAPGRSPQVRCDHETLQVRNPYETVRVFRCLGCGLALVCECEFAFVRRCLYHQVSDTLMKIGDEGGVVKERICPTCRGQPEPLAEKMHGSFIERVYWRQLFRLSGELLQDRLDAAARDGIAVSHETQYQWSREITKEVKARLLAQHKAAPLFEVGGDPYHPPPKAIAPGKPRAAPRSRKPRESR